MRVVQLSGREIEVVDFYDVGAAERVIEFRRRKCSKPSAFAAIVVSDGGDWSSALLSLAPQAGDVPVALLTEIIEYARKLLAADAPPGSAAGD